MLSRNDKRKRRLDELLVSLGYFDDLKQAQALVMAGKVIVDGVVSTKPGVRVKQNAQISVRGVQLRFASRGGYKLEKALNLFRVTVKDKVVLDAGAASGGFTDCLLQYHAKMVYAVDVGYGQLRGRLAAHSQVHNWERTNISDLKLEDLNPPIELCVADLSYLSLAKAVPALRALFQSPYEIICLVKPLFEGLQQGLQREPEAIPMVLLRLFHNLREQGTPAVNVTSSPILGSRKSIEFLILLSQLQTGAEPGELVEIAMRALETEPPSAIDDSSG
jgi:23S rRNA (cytidine1920-2'-O)/16S rRNA (cytidine1409-2'-O)-methyltransferase